MGDWDRRKERKKRGVLCGLASGGVPAAVAIDEPSQRLAARRHEGPRPNTHTAAVILNTRFTTPRQQPRDHTHSDAAPRQQTKKLSNPLSPLFRQK